MVEHIIELELHKSIERIHVPIVVRANDNDSQRIVAKIRQRGQFINLDCDFARLDIVRENGTWARIDAAVAGYTITCDLPSKAIASAGIARLAYFVLVKGKEVETTETFSLHIEDAASETAESDAYFDSSVNHIAEKWAAFESTAEQMESGRRGAEENRDAKEAERRQAEDARKQAETSRVSAEDARASAEHERASKESARTQRDSALINAENERVSAEQARVNVEDARKRAEDIREQNENTRQAQEGERVSAEQSRKTRFEQMIDAGQNVKFKVISADNTNSDGVPTITGTAGVIYLVKNRHGVTDNEYIEWIWLDGEWELFGTSGATVEPITTQDIDEVAQDGTISGTRVLNASALPYLWQKLKDRYQTRAQVDDIARDIYEQNIQSVNSSIQTLTSRADTARDECKRLDSVKASQLDVSNVRDELQRTKTTLTSRVQNLSETVNNSITSLQRSVNTRIQDALNQASQAASNFTVLKSRLAALDLKVTRDTGWQVYWQSSQDSSSRIIYKVYGNTVTVSVCVLNISGKWELYVQDSPLTQKFANYFPDEGLYCACNVIAKYGSKDTGATTTMYVSSRKEKRPYMWFYGNGGGDYYSVGTLTYTLSDYRLPNKD